MFAHGEMNVRLNRTLKFNRFLSITVITNLLAYSIINIGKGNKTVDLLLALSWIVIGGYIVFNETMLWFSAKTDIASKTSNEALSVLNTIFTALFIILISLLTGNGDFMFLVLIPIIQGISYEKIALSIRLFLFCGISIFVANFCGWFGEDFFPANSNPALTKTLSFLTITGILAYMGKIFNRIIEFAGNKVDRLHNLATTDALTGLINRREFNRRISEEFSRSKRHSSYLSLALFDIDFFKKINDTYGHNAGDAILKEIGALIVGNIRISDIACRYGGEEFALILPETSHLEAYDLLDRLRQKVEKEIFNKSSTPIKATISVGVAQLDLADKSPLEFCERADKALYKAKDGGRNRVERAALGTPKNIAPRIKRLSSGTAQSL